MRPFRRWSCPLMWYLIEDFFEQSWIMKLFVAWGWLSVLIMATSLMVPWFGA